MGTCQNTEQRKEDIFSTATFAHDGTKAEDVPPPQKLFLQPCLHDEADGSNRPNIVSFGKIGSRVQINSQHASQLPFQAQINQAFQNQVAISQLAPGSVAVSNVRQVGRSNIYQIEPTYIQQNRKTEEFQHRSEINRRIF